MKSSGSLYVENHNFKKNKNKKINFKFLSSLIFTLIIGITFLAGSYTSQKEAERAEAFDLTQWFMCLFGEDSVPAEIYQVTQTSDLQFETYSRSAISSGIDNVDSGLNWALGFLGSDFKETNEKILGRTLDTIVPESDKEKDLKFNGGVKVNPYDRFGVAGLKFTSYSGEWKHVIVNACKTQVDPQDPKAGVFYEGRLEPGSTWEDIGKTQDVRTKQFSPSFLPAFGNAWLNVISNGIFNITKAIVVTSIALMNFAFSDIVEVLGINELIAGDGTNSGIFGLLFQGIFLPLVIIVFALTGFRLFYIAIVQKQYRKGLTGLLRSIGMYLLAIIISISPATFIALPNNIVVIAQSLVIGVLNTGLSGGNGLCTTDMGSKETNITDKGNNNFNTNIDENVSILEQASKNMRSSMACQYWQNFLFKPWVEGQWGTDWNNLWAKENIAEWAVKGSTLNNINESMVGDAAVPMGDGTFINNWALFQISTQTNAHSPLVHEGELSKYTSGVANDWWRIVDANSNYTEEEKEIPIEGSGLYGGNNTIKYPVPQNNEVTTQWDTWVGNSPGSRMWTALSSVIIAGIGLAPTFIFSFLSTIYSLGISILMVFSPVMFLFGTFDGKGWEIFKGWGEQVVKTSIRRMITGLLLVASIILTSVVLKFMNDVGWWQGILLLTLLSALLIKNRKRIVDMFTSFQFSSSMSNTVNRFSQGASKIGTSTRGGAKVLAGGLAGGVAARKMGGSFKSGAGAGAKAEVRARVFQSNSNFARSALISHDDFKISEEGVSPDSLKEFYCAICGKSLAEETIVGRNPDGMFVCQMCLDDGLAPDAREITMNMEKFHNIQEEKRQAELQDNKSYKENSSAEQKRLEKSVLDTDRALAIFKDLKEDELNPNEKNALLRALILNVNDDILKVANSVEDIQISVPKGLEGILNPTVISEAWKTGQYNYIQQAYTIALATWFKENSKAPLFDTLDDLLLLFEDTNNEETLPETLPKDRI